MNKIFNDIKSGIVIGIGIMLIVGLSGLAYASFTWISQSDVSSGDILTADSWNDVLNNQNYLKQEVEGIVDTDTQLTETQVDSYVANNGYITSTSAVPPGAVMAFNLSDCPSGWSEYTPAYGRFIRGIDKSGTNIDPDGQRTLENYQGDAFKEHRHPLKEHTVGQNDFLGGSTAEYGLATNGDGGNIGSAVGLTGDIETRPKNIALLYCMKQ